MLCSASKQEPPSQPESRTNTLLRRTSAHEFRRLSQVLRPLKLLEGKESPIFRHVRCSWSPRGRKSASPSPPTAPSCPIISGCASLPPFDDRNAGSMFLASRYLGLPRIMRSRKTVPLSVVCCPLSDVVCQYDGRWCSA